MDTTSISDDVNRLHSLFASGVLMHPYLSCEHFAAKSCNNNNDNVDQNHTRPDGVCDNFVDLAVSLSMCCGVTPPPQCINNAEESSFLEKKFTCDKEIEFEIHQRRLRLASEIGGIANNNNLYPRRHIVLILCDGMGNSILQQTLNDNYKGDKHNSSFFIRKNEPSRLRAVFPSTTPAALTTLATAKYPGQHGMPGWNLRDKKGCDFPGNNQNEDSHQPVQLLVLSDRIRDARSGELASQMGFESWDDIFIEQPWARKMMIDEIRNESRKDDQTNTTNSSGSSTRRMIYVNAYNGDDYQNWVQGESNEERKRKKSDATDFSAWAQGDTQEDDGPNNRSSLFETAKIEETSFDTLGQPRGSADAIKYFSEGIDIALNSIADAERSAKSTFVYLYTAHPDKHMHSLGVEHKEVTKVVKGLESEVERFWRVLSNREVLLSGQYHTQQQQLGKSNSNNKGTVDAAVIVTADHGHLTVHQNDMVSLPQNILALLEYACIGVHGKGRHAYLHCKTGLQFQFRRRWQTHSALSDHFLLLTVEEAIDNHLFGPDSMRSEVRPRLGDFIAISISRKTLATPNEVDKYQNKLCKCQGAHGSLLPEEMSIPFILLTPQDMNEKKVSSS